MAIEFTVNAAAVSALKQASGGPQSAQQSATAAETARQTAPAGGQGLPPKGGTNSPDAKPHVKDTQTHPDKHTQSVHRKMEFSIDDLTGTVVVKVVDSQTHELIREIPQDEVLDILRHLEAAQGLLLKVKA